MPPAKSNLWLCQALLKRTPLSCTQSCVCVCVCLYVCQCMGTGRDVIFFHGSTNFQILGIKNLTYELLKFTKKIFHGVGEGEGRGIWHQWKAH